MTTQVSVPEPLEEYSLDSEPESEEASSEAATSTKEDQDSGLGPPKNQGWATWIKTCHFMRKGRRTLQAASRLVVILYSSTTSVGWWKNFSFNMLLISGGSSSILICLVRRQFCYIMETSSLQYLLIMLYTWKKPTLAFKVCWKKYVGKTTSGTYMQTWKLWRCWLGCKEVIRNFVVSCVSGRAERATGITMSSNDREEEKLF
jgi:hypothetical protein